MPGPWEPGAWHRDPRGRWEAVPWKRWNLGRGGWSKPHALVGREGRAAVFACGLRFEEAWAGTPEDEIARFGEPGHGTWLLYGPGPEDEKCKLCEHEVARLEHEGVYQWLAEQSIRRSMVRGPLSIVSLPGLLG